MKLLAMAMLSQAAVVQESQPAANMHYIQVSAILCLA